MESRPQNPEFRINPENFHPCRLVSTMQFIYNTTLMVGVHWNGPCYK